MVHTAEHKLLVGMATFEARFDDAFRYYDRCGAVVSRIRKTDSAWVSTDVEATSSSLFNEKSSLVLRFTHERLILSKNGDLWIPHTRGETLARSMASQIEPVYSIITTAFEIPNTTRVGARFSFIAKADSLEDAQVFVASRSEGSLRTSVENRFASKTFSARIRYEIEDSESGYRRNVTLEAVNRPKSVRLNADGMTEVFEPEFGVQVDVDMYTRPTEGHFSALDAFVLRAFNSAREGSQRLLLNK